MQELVERIEHLEHEISKAQEDRSRMWDIIKAFFVSRKETGKTGVKLQLSGKTWATVIGLGVIQGVRYIFDMFFA